MSRRERKKTEKRFKRILKICIFIQIIVLVCGLLIVDFQVRNTLGVDEVSLLTYRRIENNKYNIHIMGDTHLIDLTAIKGKVYYKFAQLKKMIYSIRGWVKER